MRAFVTSDIHFGHTNILKYCNRPFNSVQHMNETLIQNWNETVTPQDIVFILGDLCMGKLDDTLPLVQRLNGHKRLIPGNHDRCWTGHNNKPDKQTHWENQYTTVGIQILPNEIITNLFGILPEPALLCHFPYQGDRTDPERYTEHRPVDTGKFLLHGHVHDLWRANGFQFNVGVDVNGYRPVPAETVATWMQECLSQRKGTR
jgi:calcineurin-like phosphoesterase family protein